MERPRVYTAGETLDNEALYQAFKARLIEEAPALLAVLTGRPELQVVVERRTITADGESLRGRIARLIVDGFFSQARTSADVLGALQRTGMSPSNIELGNELKALTTLGFFTRDNKWLALVPSMVVNIVER